MLKPNGSFQFSILHPCLSTPHRRKLCGVDGTMYVYELGGYFQRTDDEIDEWDFGAAPAPRKGRFAKFRIPRFNRTFSEWLNAVLDAGCSPSRRAPTRPRYSNSRFASDMSAPGANVKITL